MRTFFELLRLRAAHQALRASRQMDAFALRSLKDVQKSAPAPAAPSADVEHVKKLVTDVLMARAAHDAVFWLADQDAAGKEECIEAIGPMDDALVAICAARPVDPEARRIRQTFLESHLVEAVQDIPDMTGRVLIALFADQPAAPDAR